MATRFESLKLDHPDLFGVRICGTVGRGDKDRLHELADKCLDRGKVQLILDMEELTSIGGGGARALAEFQARVLEAGGETVFVAVGEVVQRFLEQKFADVPLRTFANMDEAVADYMARESSPAGPDEVTVAASGRDNVEADGESSMDGVLEDVPNSQLATGRRKDHHYTSLSDAVASLGRWSDHADHGEFAQALGNLLFSHGLAEETVLLVRRGDEMVDPCGERRIPADCGLVRGVEGTNRPITLLDIHEDDLGEDDAVVIEHLNPDMILPVVVDETLVAMVMLRREGERDYSVAEHFALELLMRVMTSGDDDTAPVRDGSEDVEAYEPLDEEDDYEPSWEPDGTSPAEVLLQLALELPEAVDRPHFWRVFARHSWPVLPVTQLGFLAPERGRPQILVGGNDSWMGLELGGEKLQLFFNSMERPVAVENMPTFFKATRQEMREAGVDWVVALKWDGEVLGTVLLELDPDFACDDPTGLLEELFTETARLLSRYDGSNDNADVNLELVRILVSQREKRCFGSDNNATTMVAHVNRLARVMAFPPDQERDLTYGCLLRDIGLFDKGDDIAAGITGKDARQKESYRRHPDEGVALMAGLNLPATIVDVVRGHHERFDGTGFPRGIKGRDIPLAARVVAVVEQYVGMITGTGGRAVLRPEAAAEVLREQSGTLFDPELVEIFLKAVLPSAKRCRRRPVRRPAPQPA